MYLPYKLVKMLRSHCGDTPSDSTVETKEGRYVRLVLLQLHTDCSVTALLGQVLNILILLGYPKWSEADYEPTK